MSHAVTVVIVVAAGLLVGSAWGVVIYLAERDARRQRHVADMELLWRKLRP